MQLTAKFQLAGLALSLIFILTPQAQAVCRDATPGEDDECSGDGGLGGGGWGDPGAGCEGNGGNVGNRADVIYMPSVTVSPNGTYTGNLKTPFLEVTRHVDFSVKCDNPYYIVHSVERDLGDSGERNSGVQTVFNTTLSGVGVYFPSLNATGRQYITGPYTSTLSSSGPFIRAAIVPLSTGSTSYGVLNGEVGLPRYTIYATESSSGEQISGSYVIGSYLFAGLITYIAPTCIAEDKEIFLGDHSVGAFTGSSATEWVDASIVMRCDQSFANAYNDVQAYDNTHTNVATTTRPDNYYSVSLSPVYGFIDSDRGIIDLDGGSGVSATGVGIQLSRTQAEISWGGVYQWTDLNTPASNSINIPLFARYIQTESTVTPGSANSKVVYTVTYK